MSQFSIKQRDICISKIKKFNEQLNYAESLVSNDVKLAGLAPNEISNIITSMATLKQHTNSILNILCELQEFEEKSVMQDSIEKQAELFLDFARKHQIDTNGTKKEAMAAAWCAMQNKSQVPKQVSKEGTGKKTAQELLKEKMTVTTPEQAAEERLKQFGDHLHPYR